MKSLFSIALVSLLTGFAAGQEECPALPPVDIDLENGFPPNPAHIPWGCSDFEILVARGTGEPNFEAGGGKFGVIVGDPVVSNTTEALPGARGYPVQYPASSAIISGVIRGARDIVSRINSQSTLCPDQTFALVGYSQGGAVVDRALGDLPTSLYPKIKSIVFFGFGPVEFGGFGGIPSQFESRTLTNCAAGDPVCDPDAGSCTYYHLTYIRPEWIDPTVEFIVDAFQSA